MRHGRAGNGSLAQNAVRFSDLRFASAPSDSSRILITIARLSDLECRDK
jgi:hypothetical protein